MIANAMLGVPQHNYSIRYPTILFQSFSLKKNIFAPPDMLARAFAPGGPKSPVASAEGGDALGVAGCEVGEALLAVLCKVVFTTGLRFWVAFLRLVSAWGLMAF